MTLAEDFLEKYKIFGFGWDAISMIALVTGAGEVGVGVVKNLPILKFIYSKRALLKVQSDVRRQ